MLNSENRKATKEEVERIVNFLDKVQCLRVKVVPEYPERLKIWWPQWIDREMTWKVVHEDGPANSMKISPEDIVNEQIDAVMFLLDSTNWNEVLIVKKASLMKVLEDKNRPTRFSIDKIPADDYLFFKLSKVK